MEVIQTKKLTASGSVTIAAALLVSMHIGMDGTNDPAITIYNGASASGVEVIPTNTYDSSNLGLNGFESPFGKDCQDGIYVEITCGGTVEVIIGYKVM